MKFFLGSDKVSLTIDDADHVHLFPTSTARGSISVRNDRKQLRVECWDGIKKHEKTFDVDQKDEANEYLAQHNKNNNHSVIAVLASDITDKITTDYRYIQQSIEYPPQDIDIEPRWLGLYLVKGSIKGINVKDQELVDYIGTIKPISTPLIKSIPDVYKYNSRDIRIELLAGIVDGIAQLDKTVYDLVLNNEVLANDILELALGLGFYAQITDKVVNSSYVYKRVKIYNTYHTARIPVLVPKKDFDITKAGVIQYPQIFMDNNGKLKANAWTDEMKNAYNAVKDKYTVQGRVKWIEIVKNESIYSHLTHQALRAYNTTKQRNV